MTIDQKLHDHVLAWVDRHPGAECNTKTGKPELVAKFQRHYGSTMTDTAIKAQIGRLLLKHRPSIMPQRTNAGLYPLRTWETRVAKHLAKRKR
jgi:hypothetical protein